MDKEVKRDLNTSTGLFSSGVWPRLQKKIGGGTLISVESIDSDLARALDMFAGIDFFRIDGNSRGVQSIASRCQWTNINPNKPYDSFTIRLSRDTGSKTEFAKRVEAMDSGEFLFPFYTCQAYFYGPKPKLLISAGVIKTRDLFEYLLNQDYLHHRRTTNATFIFANWSDVRDFYHIDIIRPSIDNQYSLQLGSM